MVTSQRGVCQPAVLASPGSRPERQNPGKTRLEVRISARSPNSVKMRETPGLKGDEITRPFSGVCQCSQRGEGQKPRFSLCAGYREKA